MAGVKFVAAIFLVLVVAASASDPELTSDFKVPAGMNASLIDGNFFTFTGLEGFAAPAGKFASKKVTLVEFPALDGLGVGITLLQFNPGTVNPPHTHPRGTELLYVQEGSLYVGLLDSSAKLFTQLLQTGDLFVFPKGLVHFQINRSPKLTKAVSAFSSSNAGTVSLPMTLFGSGISEDVLEKAFMVGPRTIAQLEAPFMKH